MPLPLLIIGAAVGSLLLHEDQKEHLKDQDENRHKKIDHHMGREPSEILPSKFQRKLQPGAIVCCEVFEAFIHTGIVVDDDTIVELHGSGLIRAISKKRFLEGRSGKHIFVACDQEGKTIQLPSAEQRAAEDIFTFHEYDLLQANCYFHTWRWLTGEDTPIDSFSTFNKQLSRLTNAAVYWDQAF